MYSERHVYRRLEQVYKEYGFYPQYHTSSDIDNFEEDLKRKGKYVLSKEGVPIATQNLTPADKRWILNEQALVMCDAAYALTRYGWVIDEEGTVMRFHFRVAQKVLFEIIADLESRDSAVEIMILKARQLGCTTIAELLILFRLIFGRGINAVVASADRQKSRMMAKKIFMAYDMLPVWLRPWYSGRSESESGYMEFAITNSAVSIQHGNQLSGIARGSTPTVYHLSETASFSNAQSQIEASLFRAVHASPSTFGILESTGEGDQGWWADKWRFSKANWPHCRLFPLFLPWFVGTDLYPKPAWLRMRPIPETWQEHRLPDTIEHVSKAEAYVAAHPEIKKHLSPDAPWLMPVEQQWFWEVNHEESKNTPGGEATWYQEMAGDDIEALQRSSESVFGFEAIARVEAERKKDYQLYGISGQNIEDVHEPPTDDIDYGKDRIISTYRSAKGSFQWELIPLKHDNEYFETTIRPNPDAFWDYGQGKLQVYYPPAPGIEYSIGVDTSNGIGQDSTVISVTGKGSRTNPDFQAAEFRSAYVSHVEAFAFITAIAAWYATYMADTTPYKEPIVGIEQVAAVGDTCQTQMRRSFGYSRFPLFTRLDNKKIRPAKSNKMGWFTYGWSRPVLLDPFVHNIQNGWYKLESPWTLYECAHFEVHYTAAGKERKEHEEGQHDDGIFAAAISLTNIRLLSPMAERTTKRFCGEDGLNRPLLDFTPYSGRRVSINQPKPIQLEDLF
jgi:hypothetical protein